MLRPIKRPRALTLFVVLVGILALPHPSQASPIVIDFEDLYPGIETAGQVPGNYLGFTWSDTSWWVTKNFLPGTGYQAGTIGNVSLYSFKALAVTLGSGQPFDFIGAYIGAGWATSLEFTVQGLLGGSVLYSTALVTSNDQPYWFAFNFLGIDELLFTPGAGYINGASTTGRQLVLDNITVVPTPEASTVLLVALGLAGLSVWHLAKVRRRR
jgi:hypothetical protein